MFPPNNPLAGLPKVFLVLIVIGAVAALAFSNSDLTNFMTNSAKIENMKQQAVIQNLKDSIDIANYQKIEDAKTQAQLYKIQADKALNNKLQAQKLQAQAQQVALELEISRLFNYGKLVVSMILAVCFSITLLILMIQFVRSRLILPQAKQIDIWQNYTLRRKQIELARQRERASRTLHIRRTKTTIVPAFYTNQEEDAPIAWEDLRQQFAVARKTQRAN